MTEPLVVTPPPKGHARLRFVTTDGDFFSWLTRFGTRAPVSHVECVLPDGSIIGAYSNGVQHHSRTQDTSSTMQIFADIPMEACDLRRWIAYLESRVGRPYDWSAIAGFVVYRDWRTRGGMICSMLAALSLREANVFPLPLAVPAHEISPRDLLLMLWSPAFTVHPPEHRSNA